LNILRIVAGDYQNVLHTVAREYYSARCQLESTMYSHTHPRVKVPEVRWGPHRQQTGTPAAAGVCHVRPTSSLHLAGDMLVAMATPGY
jgi:hypothetical protein